MNIEILVGMDGFTESDFFTEHLEGSLNIKKVCIEKAGPAALRNRLVESASKELVLLVDSDVVLTLNFLKKLEQIDTVADFCAFNIEPMKPNNPYSKFFSDYILSPKLIDGLLFVPTAAFLVKRNSFLQTEGFDERFKHPGGEDWNFCAQTQKTRPDFIFRYLEDISVRHINPDSLIGVLSKARSYAKHGALFYILQDNFNGTVKASTIKRYVKKFHIFYIFYTLAAWLYNMLVEPIYTLLKRRYHIPRVYCHQKNILERIFNLSLLSLWTLTFRHYSFLEILRIKRLNKIL
jgi:hypothetical protein